jgi:germination protein M
MALAPIAPRPRVRLRLPRPVLTPRGASLLLVLALVGLQAAVSLSAPMWARLLGGPVPVSAEGEGDEEGPVTPTPTPRAAQEAERRINVKLFFEASDRAGLVLEDRAVVYHADLSRQLKAVLAELIRGSDAGLVAAFDPGTRVHEVFVSSQGCAYVDLSKEALRPRGSGSQVELMSVYAVVNTLAVNFPAVRRVQILVEDRPADSLAGHADISRPLLPDMTLLAPAAVAPSTGPAADASPSATAGAL